MRKTRQIWQPISLSVGLIALLWVTLGGAMAAPLGLPASDGEVEIQGRVIAAPGDASGIGTWLVQEGGNVSRTVIADAATKFPDGVPTVGRVVKVAGILQGDGSILAEKFEWNGNDGNEMEIKGMVESRPLPTTGIGPWVIQVDRGLTQTVVADAATRFDRGVPQVGQRVEAKTVSQLDGSLRATRLRPDEFEDGQVVARLAAGVLSATVAARYDLTPQSTLLASADIYLFGTANVDDDVQNLTGLLNADPDVLWAELNYVGGIPTGSPYTIWKWGGQDASSYVNQAAFQQVNLDPALGHYQGDGVTVAVLDTGADLAHPGLIDHLIPGRDMVADDALPQDEGTGLGWGHGTHISGVIARMAPNAKILPVRVLDSQGRGNTFILAYAIDWAVAQGADVINLSLGTPFDSQLLRESVAQAQAKGVVIVAAAGNAGDSVLSYPAAYPGVVAVTAVDGADLKPDFATYGDWVDVAAPGVGITSTVIGPDGSGYAGWTGTSMATSFVSGAAALARQQQPARPAREYETLFRTTGADLSALNPAYPDLLGTRLDVAASVGVPSVVWSHWVYLPWAVRP